jgi:hypothetical protein
MVSHINFYFVELPKFQFSFFLCVGSKKLGSTPCLINWSNIMYPYNMQRNGIHLMKFPFGFTKWNLDLYDFQKTTIQGKVCSYFPSTFKRFFQHWKLQVFMLEHILRWPYFNTSKWAFSFPQVKYNGIYNKWHIKLLYASWWLHQKWTNKNKQSMCLIIGFQLNLSPSLV